MIQLRQDWTAWDEKYNSAWWGGALTGPPKTRPESFNRSSVLQYFAEHRTDQLKIHVAQTPEWDPPSIFPLEGEFTKRDAFRHKCLVLLPGNDIASGTSWYFCGNSVVLMPVPEIEHILHFELNPWEHYVPLENGPSDIIQKLEWVLANEEEARRIVERSHQRLRWLPHLSSIPSFDLRLRFDAS